MKRIFRKVVALALVLAMAFAYLPQGVVNVKAAEDVTVSDVTVSGTKTSGYSIGAKVTNNDSIAHKYIIFFSPATSSTTYTDKYSCETDYISAGTSVSILKTGLTMYQITESYDIGWDKEIESITARAEVVDFSSVNESVLSFSNVTVDESTFYYTLTGKVPNKFINFEYELETTNGAKATGKLSAAKSSGSIKYSDYFSNPGVVKKAKITAIEEIVIDFSSVDESALHFDTVYFDNGKFNYTIAGTSVGNNLISFDYQLETLSGYKATGTANAVNASGSVAKTTDGDQNGDKTIIKAKVTAINEIKKDFSSVKSDIIHFESVTFDGNNFNYTLGGSKAGFKMLGFDYELETLSGYKAVGEMNAQKVTGQISKTSDGKGDGDKTVIKAKITGFYYIAEVYPSGASFGKYVSGKLRYVSGDGYKIEISSSINLKAVTAEINANKNIPFSDESGKNKYEDTITLSEGVVSFHLKGVSFGAYEVKIPATLSGGTSDVIFDSVGISHDGNGNYYYFFDITNMHSTDSVKAATFTGTFQGKSSYSFSNAGIGPGESKRLIGDSFTFVTNDIPANGDLYTLSGLNLLQETVDPFTSVGGPKAVVTNVGNKATAWATVKFGKYSMTSETTKDDIVWRVVKEEADGYVLMADRALLNLNYTATWGKTDYATSAVNEYLNTTFIDDAFSTDEKNSIIVSNPTTAIIEGSKSGSSAATTECKVFIPALEELEGYGMVNSNGSKCPTRQIRNSDVLKSKTGAVYSRYFLRNKGYYDYDVAGVWGTGKVCATGWRTYTEAQVVPMLKVDKSAVSGQTPGTVFAIYGGEKTNEVKISSKTSLKKLAVKGDTVVKSNVNYIVTEAYDSEYELPDDTVGGTIGDNTVTVTSVKKGATSVTIPSTVTIDGQTFKVTGISKGAFKAAKSTLKTIKVSSKNLKSVNKNAFSGVKATTTIKTNSSNYSKVKKAVKSSKAKAKVKK